MNNLFFIIPLILLVLYTVVGSLILWYCQKPKKEKTKFVDFNLNDCIRFRPVGWRGLDICNKHNIPIDASGMANMQLWQFCYLFGRNMYAPTMDLENVGCSTWVKLVIKNN